MEYVSKNHSKFLLMTHLIFICKYRKKLLIRLGEDIKKIVLCNSRRKRFKYSRNGSRQRPHPFIGSIFSNAINIADCKMVQTNFYL